MPLYNPSTSGIVWKYTNPDIPTGNTVTSNLVANPKTAFASAAVIPEQYAIINGIAHIQGRGMFGSGAVALGLTLTVEMAGVIVASVTITPALNLSNMPWSIEVNATILDNGTVEVQGNASFSSSLTAATLINIRNTTPFNMSTVGGVPVTISAQYGALAVGGTISLRQMLIEVLN